MRHRFNIVMMINIHKVYNLSFANHTKTTNLSNLLALKQTLRMQSESIIVDDFNLHHSLWAKLFYSRQHALFEILMKLMREADATLTLLENTITKDYHEERTTIDLFFTTDALINRLIKCDINHSMKNFFDHLFVETCVKLRLIEKSARCSRRDWKFMNFEKFEQYLKAHLSTSLSKAERERQRINEYIELLLKNIEKTVKNFTSWVKICDKSREFWSKECKQTIRETRDKRKIYIKNSTTYNWTKYLHVYDKKDKIIDKHKRDDYREIMRLVDKSNKRLYAIAKWIRNSIIATNTKAIVSRLSNESDVVTTTKKKTKLLFKTHFSSSLTMILNDIVDFNYVNLILDDESLTSREIKRIIEKTISNKTSSLNDISNRVIRSAMRITDEQIRSLFERCLRDDVQSAHFKRAATILLRKSSNRDYTNFKSYKSIVLLNTLSKTLKSIVSKRIRYVVEMHATLSNT